MTVFRRGDDSVSDPIRLAVIGCGYVAQNDYFPVLASEEVRRRVEVVAVCDTVPGRAEHTATVFGFGAGFTDLESTLAQACPELVAILTPIPLHFDQAVQSLRSGAHVYVQKTMTATVAEAVELVRLAAELNLVLTASPGQMLDEAHQFAARAISDGSVGEICFVRGQGPHAGHENGALNGADPTWYYRGGSGPLPDVAVYPLTSLTSLVGPVLRVTATSGQALKQRYWEGKPLDPEEDDSWVLALDFGHGVLGSVHANFLTRKFNTPQVEIYGSTGVIQLGGWTKPEVPLEICVDPDATGGTERVWTRPSLPTPANNYKPTARDLLHTIDALRSSETPSLDPSQAVHVIDVIETARRSAATGMPLEIHSTFDRQSSYLNA
jgi:predicted dehydrogenase